MDKKDKKKIDHFSWLATGLIAIREERNFKKK